MICPTTVGASAQDTDSTLGSSPTAVSTGVSEESGRSGPKQPIPMRVAQTNECQRVSVVIDMFAPKVRPDLRKPLHRDLCETVANTIPKTSVQVFQTPQTFFGTTMSLDLGTPLYQVGQSDLNTHRPWPTSSECRVREVTFRSPTPIGRSQSSINHKYPVRQMVRGRSTAPPDSP